jgi:Ca-activated chloride channel homolog
MDWSGGELDEARRGPRLVAAASGLQDSDMRLAMPLLMLIALGPAPRPQDPPPRQPTFHSAASDLVVMAATVTDGSGGFVADVSRDRFLVYDNGKPQPIVLFSDDDIPVSVGLIIDDSSSMSPKLGEVLAATVAFARSSNPNDELFALSFNDSVHEALTGRRFLLASDVAAIEHAVATLVPEGRTSLYDALMAGLDRLDEGARARKVLIVMSDGGDNASRATLEQVLDRARTSNAEIYTLGLFDSDDPDRNPKVLAKLAELTGGERYLPRAASPLLMACQRIAREIRSGYTIAFAPPARDGSYHHVRVSVERPNGGRFDVRTRPGYIAPRASP